MILCERIYGNSVIRLMMKYYIPVPREQTCNTEVGRHHDCIILLNTI